MAAESPTGSYGRVFSMTTGGTLVDNLNFNGKNGSFPTGLLVQAPNGTLYGTTIKGGVLANGSAASGEIYTITGLPAR